MPQERTRKIVIAGVLGAITCLLGITHWGFIPWFGGISLTIMHIPVIIGTLLEGPVVGLVIGVIFGIFSLIQAAVAPTGPGDVLFTNPLISVVPRLFIAPAAWIVWRVLHRTPGVGFFVSGLAGSLTNTVLVLGMFGVLGLYPWELIGAVAVTNGVPEAIVSAFLTLIIVAAVRKISVGRKKGANLE